MKKLTLLLIKTFALLLKHGYPDAKIKYFRGDV